MSASAVGLGEGDRRELLQTTGMLSREQLIHLFNRFSQLTSQPDVKKRIADAVKDKQEAVAVTTAIQEEILLEMGIDPSFGIACLGEVNVFYENDRDLMIQFYGFFAKEELACDEAELEPEEFRQKMRAQEVLQGQVGFKQIQGGKFRCLKLKIFWLSWYLGPSFQSIFCWLFLSGCNQRQHLKYVNSDKPFRKPLP